MPRVKRPYLSKDYLWTAVIVSLLLHAALFWSWPARWQQPGPRATPPATAVINYHTLETPELAQRLAQWSAMGGGELDQEALSSTPFQSAGPLSVDDLFLQAMQLEQQRLEAEQHERLQRLHEQTPAPSQPRDETGQTADAPNQEGDDALSIAQRRLAALSLEIQRYQQRPRYMFVGPSVLASPFAAYLQAWQTKVERIGTEHYPEQARGQASASLQVTVYILHTGEIERIEFDRPADDPLFNLAAQRIIHLAAPFAPFSPEMREQADILAVTRTWHFEQGQLQTSD